MESYTSILILLVAVGAGVCFLQGDSERSPADIDLDVDGSGVDRLLSEYKHVIGDDYGGYRNHLMRVLIYTNHFCGGVFEKPGSREAVEAALVFHDIALWTDGVLNYLDPSYERAVERVGSEFSEENLKLIHDIIVYHHKITDFEGDNANLVNAVRKADWIDATQGAVKHGMTAANIAVVNEAYPAAGFYDTLMAFGPKLHGWNIPKIVWELSRIYYW